MSSHTRINVGNQVREASSSKPITHNYLVAAGKIKQIINSDIFSDVEDAVSNQNLVNTKPPIADLVRGRSDNYWKDKPDSLPIHTTTPPKAAFSIRVDMNVESLEEDDENKELFHETSQALTLVSNKELFKFAPGNPLVTISNYNPEYWKAFILGISDLPPPPLLQVSLQPLQLQGTITPPEQPTLQPVDSSTSLANLDIIEAPPQVQVAFTPALLSLNSSDTEQTNDAVSRHQSRRNTNFAIQQRQLSNTSAVIRTTTTQPPPQEQSRQVSTTSPTGLRSTQFNRESDQGVLQSNVGLRAFEEGLSVQRVGTESPRGLSVTAPSTTFKNVEPTVKPGVIFFDNSFEMSVPFDKKTLDVLGAPIGSLFIDIQPTYNFFIDDYETAMENINVKEQLLPNMYAFCTELQNENTDKKNTIFKQHITLAGTIPDTFVDVTNNKGEKIGEKDSGQYFDKYGQAFAELMRVAPSEEIKLRRKFTNLVTPIENIDLFKDFNEKRELFPMYWDISFTSDNSTQFAQVLEDSQLSSLLIKDIIEGNLPQEQLLVQESLADANQTDGIVQRSIVSSKKILRSWDIPTWIELIKNNPVGSFESLQDGTFLGTLNNSIELTSNPQFDLFKNLLIIIFVGKVKQIVENNLRQYHDLLSGKMSYSESVFYRIEKRDAATGEVIQNFYLPNSNRIDIMRFIDTQVKYNKQYSYKIFVYQMVLGNKYHYQFESISDDTANIHFINSPTLKLVEVLFHEFVGRIMDNPPISPNVDIIPYRGINNQILFNINSGIGQFKLEPIIIEPSDSAIIALLREAQKVSENEFLEYESDDHAAAFEIFRLNRKPKHYKDFAGNRIALVQTDIDSITVQKATSASFIDNIIPNKKYYYIFRTIDNHGHISNPTSLYELEIVDADGSIYPIIRSVEFDTDEEQKSPFKNFRKMIKIIPAFNQRIINEQKSGLIVNGERLETALNNNNIFLGLADESVWGKTFKIRVTSKRTGKKIDFNVNFNHTHIKGTE